MNVVILSPLFWGDASGASVYYQLLAQSLIQHGSKVSVISDEELSESQSSLDYFPLFPVRCGRERRLLRDILAYAKQNLTYLKLEKIITRIKPSSVLVHTSFYNNLGIFAHVMIGIIRKHPEINFIADVRDSLMPAHKVPLLNAYNRVIACSENVASYLLKNGVEPKRLIKIPVIQERLHPDGKFLAQLISNIGLDGKRYIFYAGLVKESKAIDILLEAFLYHVQPVKKDLQLVIAGLMKTSNRHIKDMLTQEGVLYVGNRRRKEVLALMSGAALCINLSPCEGIPRSSLEALVLGKSVALPPNIPEFLQYCNDFVISVREPAKIASKIIQIMDAGIVPSYPNEIHYPENVLKSYIAVLNNNIKTIS